MCRKVTDRVPALSPDVNIVWGDITDPHFLRKTVKTIRPEVVVHLAAPSSVYYSHQHPQENIETTIIGTINLQKACESLPEVEKFLYAGSSEEYGNQKEMPIRETACLIPNQPYAIAKVAADNYLQYCKKASGFPVVVLRPFNTYGRKRNFTFVTESIILQMLTKKIVTLGNPEPIRDLLYVEDHVNGYVKTIETSYEKLENLRAINICTGIGTNIRELATKIMKYTEFDGTLVWNIKNRPTEINCLIGDWNLAFNKLNWRPQYTLDEGLILTIQKIKEKIGIE